MANYRINDTSNLTFIFQTISVKDRVQDQNVQAGYILINKGIQLSWYNYDLEGNKDSKYFIMF